MLISLVLPPGAYHMGTNYQASGRVYDCNRVRWKGNAIAPIGGWREKTATNVTGKARAIITWRDNDKVIWAGIGTHSKLYAMTLGGDVYDITPVGFTPGEEDSTLAGGYSSGTYGTGPYGTPRTDVDDVQEASQWTLDTLGQFL